jgi:glycosyltransferase involved in cell wall biosynthesis
MYNMKFVVDGIGGAPGSSVGVILERLIKGWAGLGTDDLHVLVDERAVTKLSWPEGVTIEPVALGRLRGFNRVRAQNTRVPAVCREFGAEAMIGLLPTTTIAPLPCPRLVIATDIRHEFLPHQFSRKTRVLRKISYTIGWHQADAIACISERTRRDLLRQHPWLRDKPLGVAPLGSDHVASWSVDDVDEPYTVAFGQYGNKNVDMVIDAWAILRDRGRATRIKLIGMPDESRPGAMAHIERLGLTDLVEPIGWLFGDDLRRCFASSGLFVFPSDFEGFGMPAVEAMRLGIPLVITPEDALLEVTDGKATVMSDWGAGPLADAVEIALESKPIELEMAKRRAEEFTWARMASAIRDLAAEVIKKD